MKSGLPLQMLLHGSDGAPDLRRALFALLSVGIIESLANGLLSATDAVRLFFNADNCLFVRRHLRDKVADRIRSHGIQLPDLFDVLNKEEAVREFHRELATMRALCLEILADKALVA